MKHENSKDEILSAALRLFSERGYDAVGISEITEQAGIKKPTLYYYFGSKEGLFEALLKTNYSRLNSVLANACRYDPKPENYFQDIYSVLCNISRAYFHYAQKNALFYLMALSLTFAPPTSKPAFIAKPYHRRQYEIMESAFHTFSAVHGNLAGRERTLAWRFLSAINAQVAFWYQGYAGLGEEEIKSLVNQFMHGIFA